MKTVFATIITISFIFSPLLLAEKNTNDVNNAIGLYQIESYDCQIPKGEYNACDNDKFIEIVKGQFNKSGTDGLNIVFWSGAKTESRLSYMAFSIDKNDIKENKIWLNHTNTDQEFIMLDDTGKITEYSMSIQPSNKKIIRKISYQLAPIRRGQLPHFILNYPEN